MSIPMTGHVFNGHSNAMMFTASGYLCPTKEEHDCPPRFPEVGTYVALGGGGGSSDSNSLN